jgi:hypothetical protein
MYPFGTTKRKPMSYHRKVKRDGRKRWHRLAKWVLLETAPIGQEFVLDCEGYPTGKVNQWLRKIFRHAP